MQKITVSRDFQGEELSFTTGDLAFRADASVRVQIGETVVLAIVTVDKHESSLDYFPLSVEYIEKFYAGGIISSSRFVKRERRPSDEAVLKARQIDHSIRSLFPKGFKNAVSIVITVLSYDDEHDPTDLAVTAASAALMISSVPFDGPSAALSIGVAEDNSLLVNPRNGDKENLKGHFILGLTADRVLNIEGWGDELPEETMDQIMDMAAKEIRPLYEIQKELAQKAGKEKMKYSELPVNEDLINAVKDAYTQNISDGLYNKQDREEAFLDVVNTLVEEGNGEVSKDDAKAAVEYVARKIMREGVLKENKRTSGRDLTEIRKLDIQTSVLPRVHGSSLFTRGITQAMAIVTLGSTRLSQTLESFEGEEEKRFMHHYNGPSYSFGDAGRFSYYPGRREIGHGHITENAFHAILPSEEEFPYTIRVVSEILAQNGSSSMAAACATSLALMDAGVPVKKAVAGIAVGLVTDDEDVKNYKLLTDMEDVEDFYGDMDFKVVGTEKGVTAIQLDNKLKGVPVEILKKAFRQSKEGRLFILESMNKIISKPKPEVSEHAPKVDILRIKQDKIGELIGPGGKVIKNIIEEAEVFGAIDIDIQDDGKVNITSVSKESRDKAISMINALFEEAEVGKEYDGTVDGIENYGLFVKMGNLSGLVHISEITQGFVKDLNQYFKEGDKVKVKVVAIDELNRVKLTMKGLNPEIDKKFEARKNIDEKRRN